ncbi:glucan biosynthesis glucosyltransferase H [Bordetella genomosp. 8]|uniref:Glucans biosynthesis glucosyltransferase H n=1 Tax=Bordetella genomosp. 8 TaxID=1416806 RepID=A0A1W6YS86_9BORD|nr:glucans biosynthesis glucosyltransferase MdoH [Bordetella genomosp. 8]ARP83937.1 glucan biosynthesis glucosyltransferase H [Bordetella genomosp. 8]
MNLKPNNSLPGADAVEDYLERLALPPETRAATQERAATAAEDGRSALDAVHRSLAGDDTLGGDPVLASGMERLRVAEGDDPDIAGMARQLPDSGVCLASAPPLNRTAMSPEPWVPNPMARFWRRLRGQGPHMSDDYMATAPRMDPRWRQAGSRRRMCLVTMVALQTVIATYYMKGVLPYQGKQILEVGILFLFALLFCWVSAGFWTAMMGFLQLLIGRDRYSISARSTEDAPIDRSARTAIVMPICNEDVSRVFAGLRATYESLAQTDAMDHFDIFVLSDSYKADICVAEQRAWVDLCKAVKGFGRIFYRRRRRRVKRKSGNIDDFCRRWGGNYRYMIVLDADSVMTGECLKRLVQLMEASPDAGIIQSAPQASGMDSLYARIQQFATRVYGPLFTAGMHYWQLGESHYWGHNAIIRLAPFMRHCVLAPLPGKGAFAGAILSHDFVEAALMRRAGWGVWIAYDLPGSYEELPPNLLEELQRDQRWCHGNLMNFRLFFIQGFHPVHRAVFLTGVMSYLSAPLWFLFLLLSTALLAVHTLTEPQYFVEPRQLFPIWPQWHPDKAIALFSTTAVLLFLPKVLGVLLVWARGARLFGGRQKALSSMLMEVLFSMLLAPVRMLFHTRFVVAAFLGLSAKWISPARDNDQTTWGDAFKRHGSQTLLGICWAGLVAWLNPVFLFWMAPILAALLLIIPLSVYSSRVDLGRRAYLARFFRIPEETQPPTELQATRRYTAQNRSGQHVPDFEDAVVDPGVNALACAMATARHKPNALNEAFRRQQVEHVMEYGVDALSEPQKIKLLDDPVVLSHVHEAIWRSREEHAVQLRERTAPRDTPAATLESVETAPAL